MASTGIGHDARFAEAWRTNRSYLVDLAFGMVGNIATAEDAVQEAFARLARTDLQQIEEVRGWLIVVTTRICLDHVRAASSRYEQPFETTAMETGAGRGRVSGQAAGAGMVAVAGTAATPPDPADRVTLDDEVRLALLVVLQRLTPVERVVFVLHDIFGMPFDTVAGTVGRPASTCRQLARRARIKVQDGDGRPRGRVAVESGDQQQVAELFIRACANGDLSGLVQILDPEVWGDVDLGPLDPRTGRTQRGTGVVAGTLLHHFGGATMVSNPVGSQPLVLVFKDQQLYAIVELTVEARLVRRIHVLADPARLAELDAELFEDRARPARRARPQVQRGDSSAGCSTMATTRLAINRADRMGRPDRVTSETSTVPRTLEMSTRRPARVAVISKRSTPPPPTSTRTSTRSPRMTTNGRPCGLLMSPGRPVAPRRGPTSGGAADLRIQLAPRCQTPARPPGG